MELETYLTIDEIFEELKIKDKKVKKSLDNFRDEHCDMCFAHKDIVEICENTAENVSKEEFNEAIDEIMNIAMQHTHYWREE